MGKTKRDVSEVYENLKERAKELGLNIRVVKTKAMVQNMRTGRIREILTITVMILKLLGDLDIWEL
jgi:hypothetical protein